MISLGAYPGASYEYRSKLNVCEKVWKEKVDVKPHNLKKLIMLCKRQVNLN